MYMFKKKQRFNRKDFKKVFKEGKRINNKNISISYIYNDKTKTSVVVGKKIAKKATERNLLRRRVYFILRKNFDLVKNKQIIVFVKKNITYGILKKEIEEILFKLNGKKNISDVE